MTKFEKGDRVVVSVASDDSTNYNEVGTVMDHDRIPWIKFDNGEFTAVNQKRLMLLEDWQNMVLQSIAVQHDQTKAEETTDGLVSVMLTGETVLAAVAVAVSRILKQDVKIESLIGRNNYYDPGSMAPVNPSKWEAKLVKQS